MSVKMGEYLFEGRFASTDDLKERAGVYAILCRMNDTNYLIDVGEAGKVKSEISSHERGDCWNRYCEGELFYVVHYTPGMRENGRAEIEQEIRGQYKVPCGGD